MLHLLSPERTEQFTAALILFSLQTRPLKKFPTDPTKSIFPGNSYCTFLSETPRKGKRLMPVSVSTAGISLTLSTCGHSPYLIYDEQRERSPDFCHLHCQYFPTPPSLRDTSPIFCMAKHPRKATGHGREEVLNTTPMMSFQSLAILRKEYEISSNATIQQGEKIKMVIPISTQG